MKYIIRRILIGTGIALATMFITKNVFALDNTYKISPNSQTFYRQDGSFNSPDVVRFVPTGLTGLEFNGFASSNTSGVWKQARFKLNVSTLPKGYYDMNYLFYNNWQGNLLDSYTFSFYYNGGNYVCSGNSSNAAIGSNLIVKDVISVDCNNFYIDSSVSSTLNINILTTSTVNAANTLGITDVVFIYNSSNTQNAILEQEQQQTQEAQKTNEMLEDDDTTEAQDTGSSFFNDFSSTDHGGLSGIITSPLRLINSLASTSCSSLSFPLPFVNQNVSLPCMSTIYQTHFPTFLSIYQLITTGLIGYWVLIKIFGHIRGFKDPEKDKVEVLEL